MSDTERTTDTIIDGILGAMRQDPYEMERFIRDILTEALPLVITEQADWDIRDVAFADHVINHSVGSWYEPDKDDAEVIAAEWDVSHDTLRDDLRRDEDEPLDVWLKIPDGEEGAEYEANTFRRHDGDYVIEWSHVDIGWVNTETFGTYREAVSWYEDNGYQDFTA